MESSLTMPALGENIQPGMLYNYKTKTFYSGAALWSSSVANPTVDTRPEIVQNAEYKFFTSLDDARNDVDLGVEGSLSLDIGIVQAKGSAAYLSKKKSTAYEARVDVSCTIVRRTRYIPQETLVKMEYPEWLDNSEITHFVAEIVEGGTATITFVQSCDSRDEMDRVQGSLEATLKGVKSVNCKVGGNVENTDAIKKERLSISYSGALAVQVVTLEDALRVAKEMPTMLLTQMNTLSYKLQPVSMLGKAYSRQINYLDSELLKRASDALRFGESTLLELRHFCRTENKFSMLTPQIRNMINAVDGATRELSSKLRKLLPELRDALADTAAKKEVLQSAVKLYQFQMQAASNYLVEKRGEARYLNESVEELCNHGFVNELNCTTTYSHPLGGPPTLLLSLSGEKVIHSLHHLQQHVESRQVGTNLPPNEDRTKEPPDEDKTKGSLDEDDKARVHDSYEKLKSLKDRLRELGAEAPKVAFAVANISKAQRYDSKSGSKYVSTAPGDVVLGHEGRLVVVTGKLPGDAAQPPRNASMVSYDHVVFDVPMNHRGGSEPEPINALTPTKIEVRWRRRGDSSWTGTASLEWSRDARQLVVSPLLPETKYEVQMCILTKLGPTCWSTSTAVATIKAPAGIMDGHEDGVFWFQKAANGNVPGDAWKVESPGREPQYVARAWFGNDVAFGKLHPPHKGAYFPLYGEKRTSNYEILCVSPATHAHWERASDFLKRSKIRDGDDRLLWDQNQEVVVASTWNKGFRVPGKWYHPTSTNTGWFSYDGEEHMKSPHEFDVLVIAAKQAPLNDSVWFQEAAGGLVPKCAFEISTGRNSESHFIALANEKEWQAFGQVVPSKKTAIFPIFGETRRTTYNVLCASPGTNLRWEPAAKWKQSTAKADGSRLVVAERAGIVVASCILDGARSLGKWHHPLFSDEGGWFPRGGTEVRVDADKFEVLVVPPALPAYESEVAEALDAFAITADSLRKIAQRVEEDGSRGAEPAAIDEVKREVVAVAGQMGKIERRLGARAALIAKAEGMADAQNAERCVKERRAAEREVQKALTAERQRVKEALKRVREGLEEIWPGYRLEN